MICQLLSTDPYLPLVQEAPSTLLNLTLGKLMESMLKRGIGLLNFLGSSKLRPQSSGKVK
jgi:hypothetical protein